MKRDNLVLILLLVIIVVLATLCGYFAFQQSFAFVELTDSLKIRDEYASFNGVVNLKYEKEYLEVQLKDENPFIYKSEDEIIKILEGGTGLLYFGFASSPECRSMISVLEEAADEMSLKEIYYLDIENIRDFYVIDQNDKLLKEKDGSLGYYKILNLLDSYLREYKIFAKDGNYVDTLEKRLYAPTVVAVLNGNVVGFHEVTAQTENDGFGSLTDEERNSLKKIYVDFIDSIFPNICQEGSKKLF